MRFYTQQHSYYCGIDLHARRCTCVSSTPQVRSFYIAIWTRRLSRSWTRSRRTATTSSSAWSASSAGTGSPTCVPPSRFLFVLGHALYMKAVHGGKAKNDKIDAYKIAGLLRGGMLPLAYVYPAEMRSTRDLLRRRMYPDSVSAPTCSPTCRTPTVSTARRSRTRAGVAERFADTAVQKSVAVDLALIDYLTKTLLSSSSLLPAAPKGTTPAPSTDCARCPASARSWHWRSSTRSTTSAASRGCRTSCPAAAW